MNVTNFANLLYFTNRDGLVMLVWIYVVLELKSSYHFPTNQTKNSAACSCQSVSQIVWNLNWAQYLICVHTYSHKMTSWDVKDKQCKCYFRFEWNNVNVKPVEYTSTPLLLSKPDSKQLSVCRGVVKWELSACYH